MHDPDEGELFVGVYHSVFQNPVPVGWRHSMANGVMNPNTGDLYETALTTHLEAYSGALWIIWGTGRRYIQRADRQHKLVTRVREFSQ